MRNLNKIPRSDVQGDREFVEPLKMRITKVYTRAGDKGNTRLVGGASVAKDSLRIAAYGTVDELNALLGMARALASDSGFQPEAQKRVDSTLHRLQNDLFNLGSDLATLAQDRWEGMRLVESRDIERLEQEIDSLNDDLKPLTEFILPGGGMLSAQLHQARTVARRAERVVVALGRNEETREEAIRYLNRLSDHLYVLGRWCVWALGEEELLWDRDH